jgi:hypothetical protein
MLVLSGLPYIAIVRINVRNTSTAILHRNIFWIEVAHSTL